MSKHKKIFIIAGEVSGDVLGAKIIKALGRDALSARPKVILRGIGGDNMKAAGLKSIFPISDLSVMGFFEVLAHARTLTRRINQTAEEIIKFQPDIVLTIDAPSFASRVIKKIKCDFRFSNFESRFYHVVAPQVWAWGASRAKKYAQIFDRLYAFFDFEKPYFEKYGLKTIAVGHPIADGLRPSANSKQQTAKSIALIPGSRISEVKKLLPIYKQVAEQTKGYDFYIPVVETTKKYIESEIKNWPVRPALVPAEKRYELFARTDIAIAASGTVSVELAIMHVPAVIVYKMNPVTEFLARLVLKIKWASLVNILMNKTIYPELLGRDCTAENIIKEMVRLENPDVREKMISNLSAADKFWRKSKPAAELIVRDFSARPKNNYK